MTHWTIRAQRELDPAGPTPTPQHGDVARLRAERRGPGGGSDAIAWLRIRVADRDEHGMFRGEVVEVEPAIPGIARGMWIVFGREHIVALEQLRKTATAPIHRNVPSPVPREEQTPVRTAALRPRPASLLALCSRKVATSPRLATTIVRVKPRNAQDSGLRVLADGESLATLDVPDQAAVCRLPWLLQRDPSLTFLRDVGVGARFERVHPGEPWARVDVGTRRRVPVA